MLTIHFLVLIRIGHQSACSLARGHMCLFIAMYIHGIPHVPSLPYMVVELSPAL